MPDNVINASVNVAGQQAEQSLSSILGGLNAVGGGFIALGSIVASTTAAIGVALAKLTVEMSKLGREQELMRNQVIAASKSFEEGTKAFEKFDSRVDNSSFSESIYDLKAYLNTTESLRETYLDAAEAGSVFGFSGESFTQTILKLENGTLRSANSLVEFNKVMERAGFTMADVKNKTISNSEAAERLKNAVHEMAIEQEKAVGSSMQGKMTKAGNLWTSIKENAGEFLNEGLKPLLDVGVRFFEKLDTELPKALRNFGDLKESGKVIADNFAKLLDELLPLIVDLLPKFLYLVVEILKNLSEFIPVLKVVLEVGGKLIIGLMAGFNGLAMTIKLDIDMLKEFGSALKNIATRNVEGLANNWKNATALMKNYYAELQIQEEKVFGKRIEAGYSATQGGEERVPTLGGGGGGTETKEPPWKSAGLTEEEWKEMKRLGYNINQYKAMKGTTMFGAPEDIQAEFTKSESISVAGRTAKLTTEREVSVDKEATTKRKEEEEKFREKTLVFAEKYGNLAGEAFQASLEKGGLEKFFETLGLRLATSLISALVGSAIFMLIASAATAGGAQGVGAAGGGGFFSIFKNLFSFDEGGITPGGIGRPRIIQSMGGEMNITPKQQVNLLSLLSNPRGVNLGRGNESSGVEVRIDASANDLVNSRVAEKNQKGNVYNRRFSGVGY